MHTVSDAPHMPRSRRVRKPSARGASVALGIVGILVFLILWQSASIFGWVNSKYLPTATDVLTMLGVQLGEGRFWVAVGETLRAWSIGLAISLVAGTVLGLVIGSSRFLRRATHSTIEFLRPIPSVGLIPLAVILFGIKLEGVLLLVVYACFWIILIQVLYGVADVDKVAEDTAKSLGLGTFARVRHLVWPTLLPYLVTGFRLAATVALVLAITAELVIGAPGLGSEVANARSSNAITKMYALVLASGVIGVLVNLGARAIERRLLFWHASVLREVSA